MDSDQLVVHKEVSLWAAGVAGREQGAGGVLLEGSDGEGESSTLKPFLRLQVRTEKNRFGQVLSNVIARVSYHGANVIALAILFRATLGPMCPHISEKASWAAGVAGLEQGAGGVLLEGSDGEGDFAFDAVPS